MERMGNCGRSARYYGDELAVLRGRLTDGEDAPRTTDAPDDRQIPELPAARCEHGTLLTKDCHACAFMFGWERRDGSLG